MIPNSDKNLEQFIDRTLHSLPERRAPGTLEHRVLAAIAERQALPWWHRSFSLWPKPAKLAFIGTSLFTAAVLTLLESSGIQVLRNAFHNLEALFHPFSTVANALGSSGQSFVQGIPTLWIYGSLAVIGVLYAALFGIGTAAYKTLISNR